MSLVIVILAIILLYFIQLRLYNAMWDENLSLQISFQETAVTEGETAILTETITNQKRLPLPLLHVIFQMSRNSKQVDYSGAFQTEDAINNEVFSLKPFHQIKRQLRINCPRRGYYRIRNVNLMSSNLFLSGKYKKELPLESSLFVYPKQTSNPQVEPLCKSILTEYIATKQSLEDPFLLRGIRTYQPNDPMKSINWNASARTNELQVNLFEYTTNLEVILLLDCFETTDSKEHIKNENLKKVNFETEDFDKELLDKENLNKENLDKEKTNDTQKNTPSFTNSKLRWSATQKTTKSDSTANQLEVNELAEEGIRIINTLSDQLLEQGIQTGFITNAVNCKTFDPILVSPACGNPQVITIKQSLSSLLVLRNIRDITEIIEEEIEATHKNNIMYILLSSNITTSMQQSYNELCTLHPGSILITLSSEPRNQDVHCPAATIFSMEVDSSEFK